VSVVTGVGRQFESVQSTRQGLRVQMLGPLAVFRDGVALALPASRKARALLAYLALAPRPLQRAELCDLLWDAPSDPRGELRWCLSKIRGVLDEPERRRVQATADTIGLNMGDCHIDTVEIVRATQAGMAEIAPEALRSLIALFGGEFLDGLQVDRNPHFANWLVAQRRRFRASHIAVLECLVGKLEPGSDELLRSLEQWLQLAPFDRRAHEMLLTTLVGCGRAREAEEQLAATIRLFDAEGLDWLPIRESWRAARARERAASALTAPPTSTSAAEKPRPSVVVPTAPAVASAALDPPSVPRRASICVMPFVDRTSGAAVRGGLADGLADDIITRLAKLRSLFVIARGSVFALDDRDVGPQDAGRMLNVDYVASGSVRRYRDRILVVIELTETRTARVVWAEDFDYLLDDAFLVLHEIGNRIVASIAEEIEAVERNRAILKPPSSLDAWEAYHRGLWHMYRFNGADNDQAEHFFHMSAQLDPTFARAYAALSFTHFQNAFLHRPAQRAAHTDQAFETAGRSLMADDRDPAAHWAMGRALWLRGNQEESLLELERSVDLSPNFVLGHYTLAFVHCQSGSAQAAIGSSDHSRRLSPFDPLLFGMLATRAFAHVRLGQFAEAADWAVKAAARPNAHIHILSIATHCLAAAGRLDEANAFAALMHRRDPNYGSADFHAAFRLSPDMEELFRRAGSKVGFV
jgi:DNA-binding SARP family transcriptional activator/TolB-like protein